MERLSVRSIRIVAALALALTGTLIAVAQMREQRQEVRATATAATRATTVAAEEAAMATVVAQTTATAEALAASARSTATAAAAATTARAATIAAQPTATPTALPTPTATPTPVATPTPALPNSPLVANRLVTFYGHPQSNLLGILGEFNDPQVMIRRLKAQAAAYTAADPARPAVPTLEVIASVASDTPGADGLYLNPTPLPLIEEYATLAEQNGALLLLDIQLGYDTVAREVQRLLPLLKRPFVHLAIDPEFHVKPGEVPGVAYGSLSAAEVAQAQQMLAQVVVQNNIPDKILVIHQFRADMLPDKTRIQPVPRVQIVVVMDGFGAPGAKTGNYQTFVHDELIQYGGIKLFYKQDKPLLRPEEVVALDPPPLVVIYQ